MSTSNIYNDVIDEIKTALTADAWISANVGSGNIYTFEKKGMKGKYPAIEVFISDDSISFEGNVYWNHNFKIHVIPQVNIWDREKALKGDTSLIGIYELMKEVIECLSTRTNMKLDDKLHINMPINVSVEGGEFEATEESDGAFLVWADIVFEGKLRRKID